MDLANNLGLSDGTFVVELRQPNEDTLDVLLHPASSDESIVMHTLKKGKEFSCDAESLYFSQTANAMPGALAVTAAVLLSGGVVNHTRSFARDRDGGLVMTVRDRMLFFYFGFPIYLNGTSHVRWPPVDPPVEEPK